MWYWWGCPCSWARLPGSPRWPLSRVSQWASCWASSFLPSFTSSINIGLNSAVPRPIALCSFVMLVLSPSLKKLHPLGSLRIWITRRHVDWLNMELEEIWPALNEAASGLLKVILQSVLDPYKFSIIQKITINSITLGTISPRLGGVKFSGGGDDEAILEVELDWRHGQDAKVVIQLQTTGPLLTVQIRDFVVFGVLKLIFRPLMEQFPGFGAVTISLKEPPIVDFQTKFLGGNILAIPGVDNAVDNIIFTALTDLLVWPNRLVIPILQGDYSFLMLKPVGKLKVELVEAQNVAKADIWGESDPYAVIYIRRKQGCIWTSSTKMNTNCPAWNEIYTFDVEDLESQNLTIQLFDFDRFKGDDFIGIAQFSLSQLEPKVEQDVWVYLGQDLKKDEQKFKGKVHLRLTYQSLSEERAEEAKEDREDKDGIFREQ